MSLSPKQLQNARVSVINLNSTGPVAALAVVQLDSTGGIVSGGAGGGSTQVSIKEILTSSGASVMDGVNNAINVNVVAGAAGGSTLVTVRQSSAADLNVAAVQGSTVWQVQISTVQGIVTVAQSGTWTVAIGTNLQSTATQNSNSSALNVRVVDGPSSAANFTVRPVQSSAGDLQVTATPAAGSTWAVRPLQSSAADLQVTATPAAGSTWSVRPLQSSAADLQMTATPVAGSTWRTQPGSTAWATSAGFHFDSSGALQITGASGSTGPLTVSQLLDSSGGSVAAADSANNAIRVNVVAGAAGGSTIVTVSALPLVSTTTQNSNSSALNVRVIDGPSSAANFSVRPVQSTASDLQVTATPAAGSTWAVRPLQSSQADLRVTVYQSTVTELLATINARDGSGNALESSTSAPSTGSRGLIVRPTWGGGQTFAASTVGNSSATTINASNAANRAYVYGYTIMSTITGSITGGFYDGTTLLWPILLASTGGNVVGANLAVTPPGYLFRNSTGAALTFNFSASNAGVSLGVAYWVST